MITNRDKEILNHLEMYKYTTLTQLEKIFFKEQQYSYNIARRRLGELKRNDYIKIHRDIKTNKNIYIWNEDKIKAPNSHRLILLDIFAEMKYQGFNVELFDVERYWMEGKIRSDGFTIFTINNRRYHFFVEVQLSNGDCNLEKYDKLYKSGDVQKFLGKDHFPRVLVISDRNINTSKLEYTKCLCLNTKLDSFATILL